MNVEPAQDWPQPPTLTVAERREAEDPDLIRAWAEEYARTGDPVMACRRTRWFDTRYALSVWARKVLERPDVQTEILMARASGITERRVEPHSREAVVEDLDEIREGAVMDGSWSAATSAVSVKAKVLGYTAESTVNIRVTSASELTLEQLRAMVAALPAPEIPEAEYTEVQAGG